MASRASPGKISSDDDWEDVADNYSVVSLPTSDDESEEKSIPSPRPSRPAKGKSPVVTRVPKNPDEHPTDPRPTRGRPSAQTSCQSSQATSSKKQSCDEPSLEHPSARLTSSSLLNKWVHTAPVQKEPIDTTKRNMEALSAFPMDGGALDVVTEAKTLGKAPPRVVLPVPSRIPSMLDLLGTPVRRAQDPSIKQPIPERPAVFTTTDALDLAHLSTGERQERAPSNYEKADAAIKQGGTIGESLDFDESSTNPVFINDGLQVLDRMLKDTYAIAAEPKRSQSHAGIQARCEALAAQVNDLLPILAKYADHWEKPNSDASDVPLDPSLMMWIAALSRTLTDLQEKMRMLDAPEADSVEYERILAYLDLINSLADYQRQMDDFLPIMQVDFNDFQTKHMSFPFPSVTKPSVGPRRNFQAPNRDTDQIPRIRQTLYGLKDEVQRTITILKNCQKWLSEPATVIVNDVVCAMGIVFDAVSQALTNNGSEWIESDLLYSGHGRPLTHAEFISIDPVTIEDLTRCIRRICDVIDVDTSASRTWSADMIRQHHVCMLIEQQQIDSLESIASVLKQMMYPSVKKATEVKSFLKEI